jgi:hypothetical protein
MSTTAVVPVADTAIDRMIDRRCAVYRHEFGSDTFRAPRSGAICMSTGEAWAVIVSKCLGAQVGTLLREQPAPIFSVDRPVWVFLPSRAAQSGGTAKMSISLYKYGAVPVFPAAVVALPTPGRARRCCLHLPDQEGTRPAFDTVTDAIRAAAPRAGRS